MRKENATKNKTARARTESEQGRMYILVKGKIQNQDTDAQGKCNNKHAKQPEQKTDQNRAENKGQDIESNWARSRCSQYGEHIIINSDRAKAGDKQQTDCNHVRRGCMVSKFSSSQAHYSKDSRHKTEKEGDRELENESRRTRAGEREQENDIRRTRAREGERVRGWEGERVRG